MTETTLPANNETSLPDLPYFSVSTTKLVVMTLCTCGLYEAYWFYKNWSLIKKRDASQIRPFWRAVFSIIHCPACFADIKASAVKLGLGADFNALGMAAGWILTTILWKLPDPYWLISDLAVLFLIPAQNLANEINRTVNPDHKMNSSYSGWNILAIVVGGLFMIMGLVGAFMPSTPAAS